VGFRCDQKKTPNPTRKRKLAFQRKTENTEKRAGRPGAVVAGAGTVDEGPHGGEGLLRGEWAGAVAAKEKGGKRIMVHKEPQAFFV